MAMKYRIVDQKCEHLTCPLGIDAQSPQLSWIYEGENDLGLGAQIRVVASLNEDIQGEALWDSGWKESALTAMHYEGPALKSGQRVYWKAMTRLSGRDETLAAWAMDSRGSGLSGPGADAPIFLGTHSGKGSGLYLWAGHL